MKRTSLLVLLLPLLSACGGDQDRLTDEQAMHEPTHNGQDVAIEDGEADPAPGPSLPQEPGELVYKALGTEPGWALTVRQNAMLYQGDYGTIRVIEATPPQFSSRPGTYRSGRLSVTISPGPCSDGMSDHVWRDKVTVAVAAGTTERGCGGGLVEVNAVENSSWTVTAINGRPTGGGSRYQLTLSGTEIRGSFGCNNFSGNFSRNGDHLSASQIIGTQMGCGDPFGRFEREGLAVLASNMRIEESDGRMRLVSEAGSIDLAPLQQEGTTA